MKNRCIIIIMFVCAAFYAQSITLNECQNLAQNNYPLINKYSILKNSEAYTLSNASKGYLPSINVLMQATWQNAVVSFPQQMQELYSKMGIDMKGLNKDQYIIGIEIYQNLWDGGEIKSSKNITKLKNQIDVANVDVERYHIRSRINDIYFSILLLNYQLEQNSNLAKLLQNNCDKIKSLIKNGVAYESDLALMEAELLSANQNQINLQSTKSSFLGMLSLFIGRDITGNTLVVPEYQNVTSVEALNRPEEKLFESQRSLIKAELRQIESSLMPKIGAFAQSYYGNPGFNMFDDMVNNKWSFNFLVGVKVSWNIGSLYRKKNNISNIKLKKEMVDVNEDIFKFNNNLQVLQQQNAIIKIEQTMKDDDKIINLRTIVRKSSESKLINGVIDANDLLQDITKENQALINKDLHKVELLKNIYDLKYLLNY